MTSVPDQARLARGRVIAATPGAVIRFDNYHYKVRSQSAGGQGVNITPCPHYDVRLLSTWRCTCPDFSHRRRTCKHIYALKEIRHAQQEAQHYITPRNLTEEELLEMILQQLQDPELPGAKHQRLAIYRNALTLPQVPFELRYWWKGRDPEHLFDVVSGITYLEPEDGIKVRTPQEKEWRFTKHAVEYIREYVVDHGLHVVQKEIETTRRSQFVSWRGLFILTFATNGHGQFTTAPLQEVINGTPN
jgi:hypothetical protein